MHVEIEGSCVGLKVGEVGPKNFSKAGRASRSCLDFNVSTFQ